MPDERVPLLCPVIEGENRTCVKCSAASVGEESGWKNWGREFFVFESNRSVPFAGRRPERVGRGISGNP